MLFNLLFSIFAINAKGIVMKKVKILNTLLICLFLYSLSLNLGYTNSLLTIKHEKYCFYRKDTFIEMKFSFENSKRDFFELIDFIEKQGEFRSNKNKNIDSSTHSQILLQRLLCPEKDFDSPIEHWKLSNLFSIRYYMTSIKPIKGTKNLFPKFDITQINFKSEEEKNIALKKIEEIGWGDPHHKWNDYTIISGKFRIYIIESHVTAFGEKKEQYAKLIEKKWSHFH